MHGWSKLFVLLLRVATKERSAKHSAYARTSKCAYERHLGYELISKRHESGDTSDANHFLTEHCAVGGRLCIQYM